MLGTLLRRPEGVPLSHDVSARFLTALIALMVWLATLALAGALVLDRLAADWRSGLSGSVTIEIAYEGERADARARQLATRDQVLAVLAVTPGVTEARAIGNVEVQGLLEPWLGQGVAVDDLPLPLLIDVALADPDGFDLASLEEGLLAAHPNVRLHSHQRWLQELLAVTGRIKLVAWGVVLVASLAAVVAVAFATAAGLSAHREVVAILHMIGAHDGFIARQFQRHVLRTTVPGAFAGWGLAIAVPLLVQLWGAPPPRPWTAAAEPDPAAAADLLPRFALAPELYPLLMVVPLAAVLIAILTARTTVFRQLRGTYPEGGPEGGEV